MNLPKIRLKLKLRTWLLVYYVFLAAIIVLGFGWATLFLRKYLNEVTSFEVDKDQQEISTSLPAAIRINEFDAVVQNIENKTKRAKPPAWKNIFNP